MDGRGGILEVHVATAPPLVADGAGRGEADQERGRGGGKGKKATGEMTSLSLGSELRWVSWNLEVLVWRCRARLPDVLGSFLKFLMTRMLVAGSLLVSGRSSGS